MYTHNDTADNGHVVVYWNLDKEQNHEAPLFQIHRKSDNCRYANPHRRPSSRRECAPGVAPEKGGFVELYIGDVLIIRKGNGEL